jgi:hypothetical protein
VILYFETNAKKGSVLSGFHKTFRYKKKSGFIIIANMKMDNYKNIHLLIICCVLELEQIIYDVVKARVCGFVSFEVT